MKRIISLLILACMLSACTILQTSYTDYPTDNYKRLTVGMSKMDAEYWIGVPVRYLDARRTAYGYEEVLLYRNRYNEYFALQFVNDYLVSSNYVYNEVWYPMYPSYSQPAFGKPVFPSSYRPNRPYYPSSNIQQGRPIAPGGNQQSPSTVRPPSTTRPGNNSQTPNYAPQPSSTTRSSTGTNSNTRESTQPSSTTRSSNSSTGTTTRESTQPSSTTRSSNSSTGTTTRESTQPSSTTRSSNSSTGTTSTSRESTQSSSTTRSSGQDQNTETTTRGSNTR